MRTGGAGQAKRVKWKNIDIGASYCYITATCTEWVPLLNNAEARRVVCEEIGKAFKECGDVTV